MSVPTIVPIYIDFDSNPPALTKEGGLGGELLSVSYVYANTNTKNVNLKLERYLGKNFAGVDVWETVLTHNGKGGTLPGDNERVVYVEPTVLVAGGAGTLQVRPRLPERYRWVATDPGGGIDGTVHIYMMVQPNP